LNSAADTEWRFLPYEINDGETNMALDEAILEAHLSGLVPPTLRFYGFKPAAITVGYSQTVPHGLLARAAAAGIDVVRRPTGGRAVLHLDELTYSFIGTDTTCGGILEPSIAAAYRQICRGLQLGLEQIGLSTELGNTDVPYRNLDDCFQATTGSDLHHKGKKIAGSAQLRRRHGVLQHGSILLAQDQDLLPRLLGSGECSGDARIVTSEDPRHANVFEICGEHTIDRLQDAFRTGFQTAFGISLETGDFTAMERATAEKLKAKFRLVDGTVVR
jgi:lipoyl(octanoyl) transferase